MATAHPTIRMRRFGALHLLTAEETVMRAGGLAARFQAALREPVEDGLGDDAPASDHERVCPILHIETERVLSLDELGRELEFGVRQLEAESTSGSADDGAPFRAPSSSSWPVTRAGDVLNAAPPELLGAHRPPHLQLTADTSQMPLNRLTSDSSPRSQPCAVGY
jgi:hypothetical protein